MGYHQAGFDVFGVDIVRRDRYPFAFCEGDTFTVLARLRAGDSIGFVSRGTQAEYLRLADFSAIHASPPCQAHTSLKTMPDAREHANLIPATRVMLGATGLPYVIENVVGAVDHLIDPVVLCGSMFKLGAKGAQLRRHRLFETNFQLLTFWRHCTHRSPTIGIYGEGCRDSRRKYDKTIPEFTVEDGREAMGMPWASIAELCEAIPPAYTRFIGEQLLTYLSRDRLAA